jgi:hypothetical protein
MPLAGATIASAGYHVPNTPSPIKLAYQKAYIMWSDMQSAVMQFAKKIKIDDATSNTLLFTKAARPTRVVTALGEGENPSGHEEPTYTEVQMTLANYGNVGRFSDLFAKANYDSNKSSVQFYADQRKLSLDWLMKLAMYANAASNVYPSGVAAPGSITKYATGNDLSLIAGYLGSHSRLAKKFPGGVFKIIVPSGVKQGFFDDSTFRAAFVNSNSNKDIQNGTANRYCGMEIIEDEISPLYFASGDVTASGAGDGEAGAIANIASKKILAACPAFGMDAYAVSDWKSYKTGFGSGDAYGKGPNQLVIVDQPDSYNPLNAYQSMGWKSAFAGAVLQSAHIVHLLCPDKQLCTDAA